MDDNIFVSIILDTQTNLEWYVGQNKDTTWDEARSWVKNLLVGGGGWRLPTIKELRKLYFTDVKYSLNSVFGFTDCHWFWACDYSKHLANPEEFGVGMKAMNFGKGGSYTYKSYKNFRVLACRLRPIDSRTLREKNIVDGYLS